MALQACDSSTSPSDVVTAPPSQNNLCADIYSCKNITLLANLSPQQLLGERLNDIWGWTDLQTGKEYALVGLTDRLTFVDISSPEQPVVVGTLPKSIGNVTAGNSSAIGLHHDEEEGEGKSACEMSRCMKITPM